MIQAITLKAPTFATPGADSAEYVMFSTVTGQNGQIPKGWAPQWGLHSYRYSIDHSHLGTIKGYYSKNRGTSWIQFYEQAVLTGASLTSTDVVLIEGFDDFEFRWVNGGTAQNPWDVVHDLSTFP